MIRTFILVLAFLVIPLTVLAQDTTTVEANSEDIADNLDLEVVASVFGEAEDLEDFEKRLNDPETQITNLDMNEDGEVDYLRVVEIVEDETHFITIQAVLGEDQFQDVATIEVERDSEGETQVQVVGDVYMYGPGYICEPVYVHPPVIFVVFWTPYYSPWYSPWYWGHHPPYYRPWRPYPCHRYRTNVRVNINVNNSYSFTSVRRSKTSVNLQKENRRNDFGKKNPDRSFEKRNPGTKNKRDLRPADRGRSKAPDAKGKDTGRPVQDDWKPTAERKGQDKTKVTPGTRDKKQSGTSPKKPEGGKQKPQTKPQAKPKPKPEAKPKTPQKGAGKKRR